MATICFPGLAVNKKMLCYIMPYLNLNKCKEAIQYLRENPQYICWDILSMNPFAIDLLLENQDKIWWTSFCKNPEAIDIILKNPENIDWSYLSTNPEAIDILTKNPDKINYLYLSENPNALHLIIEHLETAFIVKSAFEENILLKLKSEYICSLCVNENKELIEYIYLNYKDYICWKTLSRNPAAIDILLENMDKIDYKYLSANPKATKIMMEKYPHYIDWREFSLHVTDYAFIVKCNPELKECIWYNPIIFDYNAISKYKMDIIKEELMMKTLHPSRIQRLIELGCDIDDL
jgi:hypothetical protein